MENGSHNYLGFLNNETNNYKEGNQTVTAETFVFSVQNLLHHTFMHEL
jgi:hypothetical protein